MLISNTGEVVSIYISKLTLLDDNVDRQTPERLGQAKFIIQRKIRQYMYMDESVTDGSNALSQNWASHHVNNSFNTQLA